MNREMAYEVLSRLLEADRGLKSLDGDTSGKAAAIGRTLDDEVESVFFLQNEHGDTVIRLQVNGRRIDKEIQDSRKFKKYWKAKSRFLEDQGVHIGIGEKSQFYFSVVTRTPLQDLERLLSVEGQLKDAVETVAGEIKLAVGKPLQQ